MGDIITLNNKMQENKDNEILQMMNNTSIYPKLADQGAAPHAVADGQAGILITYIDQIPLRNLRIVFRIRIDGVSVQIQHLVHGHRHEDDVVLMQTGVSVKRLCFDVLNHLHHRAVCRVVQRFF